MVLDKGMINGYGLFGWIIANDNKIQQGQGEAEGSRNLMQSFRAEGYGMLAALRYLLQAYTYTRKWPTTPKIVHMYCDNLALIQRIGWHKKRIVTTPKDVFQPDYNIEVSIKETIDAQRVHKIFIKEKHVSGHKDRYTNYEDLKREEQLNVNADKEATTALHEHKRKEEYNQLLAVITMLYHKGLPVTSKEAETLQTAYGQITYKKHVTRKENWKPSTYAAIWWEVHSRALAKLKDNDRTRITKLINGILPTNVKLHQQDK